jgi:hypothetical protein
MGRRAWSGTESVWFTPQVLHSNTLKYLRNHLFIWINRMDSTSNYGTRFAPLHRVLLLAKHHARSRPKLNHTEDPHVSGAVHERFDQATTILTAAQSHRSRSHAAIPTRYCYRPSSFGPPLSNRMRRRRRDRKQPKRHCDSQYWWGRTDSQRVSNME